MYRIVASPKRQRFYSVHAVHPVHCKRQPHSLSTLSAHSMSCTSIAGLAKEAFFPARSDSRTPRALEQAPQTWTGTPSTTVARRISASGGQPTGTTAAATGSRMRDTASPRMKIWASWPASLSAFACRNGNAAFVGSSEPQALFTSTFMLASPSAVSYHASRGELPADPVAERPAHDELLVLRREPRQLLGEHRHALLPRGRHARDVRAPEHTFGAEGVVELADVPVYVAVRIRFARI